MQTINDQIRAAMAKAFFASAWADMQEEKDSDDESRVNLSGKEIFDVMPSTIDPAAEHAARTLAMDLERANGASIVAVFCKAKRIALETKQGDRDLTPENFGHYLAMQAMGHGVGLESFGDAVRDAITVPYVEFGSHSLEKDY
jgi:hypothetical protein